MRILHVTLANPWKHNGGLNRYCAELAEMQRKLGYSVDILFPSELFPIKKIYIKKFDDGLFGICGALPIAITYGVDEPTRYTKSCNAKVYLDFLNEFRPEIIHVHSIMGIHKEFFAAAKKLSIPILFTTHDYYPLCFKCTLLQNDGALCGGRDFQKCAECNQNKGLHIWQQILLQSRLYHKLKSLPYANKLKRQEMQRVFIERDDRHLSIRKETCNSFRNLGIYYDEIMSYMNIIHANSYMTREIYQSAYPKLACCVIPITHNNLIRKSHIRKDATVFHFGYLGGANNHKGYHQLLSACALLSNRKKSGWVIDMYGGEFASDINSDTVRCHGHFSKQEESKVWEEIDVLVVPSVGRETYGFAVLEALCQGIPAICSDLVGSCFLVKDIDESCIYPHNDIQALSNCMEQMLQPLFYKEQLIKVSKATLPNDMCAHAKEMEALYNSLQKEDDK